MTMRKSTSSRRGRAVSSRLSTLSAHSGPSRSASRLSSACTASNRRGAWRTRPGVPLAWLALRKILSLPVPDVLSMLASHGQLRYSNKYRLQGLYGRLSAHRVGASCGHDLPSAAHKRWRRKLFSRGELLQPLLQLLDLILCLTKAHPLDGSVARRRPVGVGELACCSRHG